MHYKIYLNLWYNYNRGYSILENPIINSNQGCRKWQENLSDKLSSVGQFGFGEYTKSVPLSNCWTAIYENAWIVLCPTFWLPGSDVSNSSMVGKCCVQQFDGWTVICPAIQWSDFAMSNCQLVGQCCVKMSNGWTVLCPIVHWLVSAVSSCLIVGQCFVLLSIGRTVLCQNVQWLDSALSNCPMIGRCCVQLYNDQTVIFSYLSNKF